MATTISTAATEITERLKLVVGTGAQPSSAMIEGFLRGGFKVMWSTCQPIFRGAFTVNSTNGVTTVSADLEQVLYVVSEREVLIPGAEWVETEDGVNFRIASETNPSASDTVLVWYTTAPTDFNSALTIESTCIFGPDWLEEAAMMWAEIQSLKRMSRVHDSAGSNAEAAAWVTIQQGLDRITDRLLGVRQAEINRMEQRLGFRLQARGLLREPAMAYWNNESGLRNTTIDAYGGITRRDR